MMLRLGFFYVGPPMGRVARAPLAWRLLVVPWYGSCYGYFGEFRVEVWVVMVLGLRVA